MCRLNGQKPNARDRWQAFHRLWRIATRRATAYEYEAIVDSFRVLYRDWCFIRLVEANESSPSRVAYPTCIRRRLLETERKRRLNLYQFPVEYNQKVARTIREKDGIEMTPDQVAETRQKAFARIREVAEKRGIDVPDDDLELVELMRAARDRGD